MGHSNSIYMTSNPYLSHHSQTILQLLLLLLRMSSLQSWVSEHKLTSVGALWASAVGASLAYTTKRSPLKPSMRLIHARMHAQALTLAVLSSAAIVHYYDAKHNAVDDDEKLAHNVVS